MLRVGTTDHGLPAACSNRPERSTTDGIAVSDAIAAPGGNDSAAVWAGAGAAASGSLKVGGTASLATLNAQRYIDVTFFGPGGAAIDAAEKAERNAHIVASAARSVQSIAKTAEGYAAAAQQVTLGNAHIDVHRIQLIHRSEQSSLRGNQSPFVIMAAANPTRCLYPFDN